MTPPPCLLQGHLGNGSGLQYIGDIRSRTTKKGNHPRGLRTLPVPRLYPRLQMDAGYDAQKAAIKP